MPCHIKSSYEQLGVKANGHKLGAANCAKVMAP